MKRPKKTSFCGIQFPQICFLFVLLIFSSRSVPAQTAIPARPVDPDQATPAQPVGPKAATPAAGTGATNSTAADSTSDANIPQLSILADSSLKKILQELAQAWTDRQPDSPQMPLTLTNAGTMATQMESSPTWDVVISADAGDLKAMTDKGLLLADGQRSLARNEVVIYGRKALVKDDDLDWFDLVGSEWKKVALGNPDLVESGRVAKRALLKHDLYDEDHKDLFVKKPTEALALQVVERDQADAVFLYRTDLAETSLPGFEVVPLNAVDAPPVFYTAAVGRLAKNPEGARSFIQFIGSEAVRAVWSKYGFEMN